MDPALLQGGLKELLRYVRYKHSSLFAQSVSEEEEKKFFLIDCGLNVVKPFSFFLTENAEQLINNVFLPA
jgi:hypothetical protein